MPRKLDSGHKHFLRLIHKEQQCPDGWAKVSAVLMPLVKTIPGDFVETHTKPDGSGLARLTTRGEFLIEAMEWL